MLNLWWGFCVFEEDMIIFKKKLMRIDINKVYLDLYLIHRKEK